MAMDYKSSGVDVEAGEKLVDWLKVKQSRQKSPHKDKILSGIGGFAALFKADFSKYEDPYLVSSTDGIGTKLKLGVKYNRYKGLGQDLVAMCVNDLVCCGADPLFFLDYYAVSKLDLNTAQEFIDGIREACHKSDMALIGGETAEMPGVYSGEDFDCAGFSIGVVDRKSLFDSESINIGDSIIGFASSGFHSNGYSLIRKIFESDMDQYIDELIKPTELYVDLVKGLKKSLVIKSAAHITGGGIQNLARVIPEKVALRLENWEWPNIFKIAQKKSKLSNEQMLDTFNCGIGFAIFLSKENSEQAIRIAGDLGYKAQIIGEVITKDPDEKNQIFMRRPN